MTSPWQRAQWNLASFSHTAHALGLPCSWLPWLPCSIGVFFLCVVSLRRRAASSSFWWRRRRCVRASGAAQLQIRGQLARRPLLASAFIALASPPARLVGSTAPTRTAFRVLWRSIRAATSVNFLWLPHVSGLIERECQDASIKPLTCGNGPLLTKIVVFPLGCPDALVWGARAAKSPRTV